MSSRGKRKEFKNQRGTTRELKKKDMERIVQQQEVYLNEGRNSFGASKYGTSLTKKYKNSVQRYGRISTKNLYSIIIPSGMGKTFLSSKYGVLDVDEVLCNEDFNDLVDIRRQKLYEDHPDWKSHNDVWCAKVRNIFSSVPVYKPTIILCHTEEFALEIGARPLCAITTRGDFGLRVEDGRDNIAHRFGMLNRNLVRSHTVMAEVYEVQTHSEVEQIFIGYAMQYIPIPCPWSMGDLSLPSVGYVNAPAWAMRGEFDNHTLEDVEILHRSGQVPDCLLEKAMLDSYGLVSDIGMFSSMLKWIEIKHLVDGALCQPADYVVPDSFPHRSKLEGDRAGIKLVDVISLYDLSGDVHVQAILSHHVGSSHTLVAGLMVYYASVVRKMRVQLRDLVISSKLLLVPEKRFVAVNKEAYTYVRVSKEFFNLSLSDKEQRDLMYIHTLTGRKMYKVDPTDEIKDRQRTPNVYKAFDGMGWSHQEYTAQRDIAIQWLYRKAGNSKLRRFDEFIDFWVKRSEYVSKGSTVLSEDFEKKYSIKVMMDGVVHEVSKRHNKKSLFEQEGIYEIVSDLILKKWGTNRSKAVPKMNEIGAERVLFPGELIQYIVMACAYFSFSECFAIGSTNLYTITQEHIYKYDMRLRDTVEGMLGRGNWYRDNFFCFDFKNFNTQHTIDDMIEITNGLLKHAPTSGNFLRLCFRWIEDSYKNMHIIDNEGLSHEVTIGLFSGWMYTMLMNCMANDVYFSIANISCLKLYGKTMLLFREGLGDDGASRTRSIEAGCIMYDILTKIGYEANSIKQLLGGTMEFLRVMYGKSGDFGSCLCRLIATFVSGNMEHEPISIQEMVKTKYEVVEKLYNRGMSKDDCDILWACSLNRWGRVKTIIGWKDIDPTVLHAVSSSGGFGIPDENGDVYVLDEVIPDLKLSIDVEVPGMLAASDRVDEVQKRLAGIGVVYTPCLADIKRIAQDSYDTQQVVDHIIADSADNHVWCKKYIIRDKINTQGGEVDIGLTLEFFCWMESRDNVLSQAMTYQQYRLYVGVDELALRSVCGNWKFDLASSFSPATIHYPMIPEYLKTFFSDYVKSRLLRGYMTLRKGEETYANLCCTMHTIMVLDK